MAMLWSPINRTFAKVHTSWPLSWLIRSTKFAELCSPISPPLEPQSGYLSFEPAFKTHSQVGSYLEAIFQAIPVDFQFLFFLPEPFVDSLSVQVVLLVV
jgi:hypothetical protein